MGKTKCQIILQIQISLSSVSRICLCSLVLNDGDVTVETAPYFSLQPERQSEGIE